MKLEDVETPALIVLLDQFEHNLKAMVSSLSKSKVPLRFRPHAKTHKSVFVAKQQIGLGAVGVCVQKTSEAEAMVEGGIPDVLISNEVVDPGKLQRLAFLARRARVSVCCDDATQVEAIARAARNAKSILNVLVELNVGGFRCGTTPQQCVIIAQLIRSQPSLTFGGIQAYHGSAQHIRKYEDRKAAIFDAAAVVFEARTLFQEANIPIPVVTGGGTGTYLFEMESGQWDELQAGSYCFMDVDYARNKSATDTPQFDGIFRQSLFVMATVMSRAASNQRAVVDSGMKGSSCDSGPPSVYSLDGTPLANTYAFAGDEHGLVSGQHAGTYYGKKLFLAPGHCDPTVNMHDWGIGVRDGIVEVIWPICRSPGF